MDPPRHAVSVGTLVHALTLSTTQPSTVGRKHSPSCAAICARVTACARVHACAPMEVVVSSRSACTYNVHYCQPPICTHITYSVYWYSHHLSVCRYVCTYVRCGSIALINHHPNYVPRVLSGDVRLGWLPSYAQALWCTKFLWAVCGSSLSAHTASHVLS